MLLINYGEASTPPTHPVRPDGSLSKLFRIRVRAKRKPPSSNLNKSVKRLSCSNANLGIDHSGDKGDRRGLSTEEDCLRTARARRTPACQAYCSRPVASKNNAADDSLGA